MTAIKKTPVKKTIVKKIPVKKTADMVENDDDINFQDEDVDFTERHYRIIVNGKLSDLFTPSIDNARRIMADMLKGGGVGRIYECVEMWSDMGATLHQEELVIWP